MAYGETNYPYNQPIWNVNDQNYWCKMVNTYRYPMQNVRDIYRYILEQKKCSTFEAEYNQYLYELNNPPVVNPPTEPQQEEPTQPEPTPTEETQE